MIEGSYLKIGEISDVFVANRAANRPPFKCFENLVLKLRVDNRRAYGVDQDGS